jgi:serine protease Do
MNWNNEINNQNQYKVPEYSFWAEQAYGGPYANNNQPQGNPYFNNNQGANNWGNVQMPNNNYYYNNQYGNNQYGNNMNNPYGSNMNNPYNNMVKKQKTSKNSRGGKVMKFIGKAACFGLIAGVGFFGFQQVYSLISPGTSFSKVLEQEQNYEIGYTQPGTVKVVDNSAISEVTKNTLPSIVSINISAQSNDWFGQQFEVQGSGSGIIVGKTEKELLIATNNHVVEGTSSISITFADGSEADAIIKGTDVAADLAVVSVDITKLSQDTLNAISVAKLGNSDEVKVGEMAIAIGNALGYGQSVTVGYISAKDREVDVPDQYNNSKNMVLLQTDAAINPGNSGGALLNSKGEVIGINTVKYAENTVEGMGFAIPISKATPIITELMNREILSEEEQGYLGIAGNDVTEDVASYYNMPVGVFVNEVTKGGAAEKAGLQSGDIITKVDDIEVTSITQLRDYVNSKRVGTDVQVTYMRNANGKYEQGTVKVTLGQNPNLSAVSD